MRALLLAIVAACLCGGPQVAQGQGGKADTPNGKGNGDTKQVPPLRVVIQEPIPTIRTQPVTGAQQDQPPEKPLPWFSRPEWVSIYVAAIYSLIAGLTLWAIRGQANTMNQQRIDSNQSGAATLVALNRQITALESQAVVMERQAKDIADANVLTIANATETLKSIQQQANLMEAQVNEMRRAGEQSAAQLVHMQRPWVAASPMIVSPLTWDAQGLHITFRTQLTNFGNSPAMGVWIHPSLYLSGPTKAPVSEERQRVCERLKTLSADLGSMIFPNAVPPYIQDWSVSASGEDITTSMMPAPAGAQKPYDIGMLGINVIVGVSYRSTIDPEARHYTVYVYDLYMTAPGNEHIHLAIPVNLDIPIERLRLVTAIFPATVAT